ncbi:pyridoxal 5'-phosphate synthase glutaminase subunit PdxT, partial [bacterium]|nr:pyridoxal 5'-phosphate synthase glutaminase subunit PdxT [bacterium]
IGGRQGNVAEHESVLSKLGVPFKIVLCPDDLVALRGVILPGGETTTQRLLWQASGLWDALKTTTLPLFGFCAGGIHLANDTSGKNERLSRLDIDIRRNAFGNQKESFQARLNSPWGLIDSLFIRAPRIERIGTGVEVLSQWEGEPVVVREGNIWASTSHPESCGETQWHQAFVDSL